MVAEQTAEMGPGTMRVGRLIGRLGVVALPAIGVGLGLAERVVRRHVVRLESCGFLERRPAVRGQGSLVWLTSSGLAGVGLGELVAVRVPDPFSPKTAHPVAVAWAAARLERAGVGWRSARELAVDRERWQITVENERGGESVRLPDLAAWPRGESSLPVAVVIQRGGQPHQTRRQRALLEGWQHAIQDGRYAAVRYQTGPVIGRELERQAAQLGLTASMFGVAEQLTADQLLPDPAALADGAPPSPAVAERRPAPVSGPAPDRPEAADRAGPAIGQTSAQADEREAERQRLTDAVQGISEPQPRRRWRRG